MISDSDSRDSDSDSESTDQLTPHETTSHRAFSIDCSYVNKGQFARGNMGAIVRAYDRDIERDVALKVMLERNSSPAQRMRFLREAQITGQLEHPNIVPIHSLGTDTHGNPVFAMKLVRGTTLEEVIEDLYRKKRKALRDWPLDKLVEVLVQVCNALAFAHARGVIHRDLKPANIMLGDFGEVLVMDWGLAKTQVRVSGTEHLASPIQQIAFERRRSAQMAMTAEGTNQGTVIGTPKYMSPEQARGDIEGTDTRSDIYSLGAILYDMLTLSPPIRGTRVSEILKNVRANRIVPVEERAPSRREIPKELTAVAFKAMAAHPADRYQTAEDLRADLEAYRAHRRVSAKEDSGWESMRKLIRRHPGNAVVTALAGILIAVIFVYSQTQNAAARARTQESEARLEQAIRSRAQREVALAPLVLAASRQALIEGDEEEALRLAREVTDMDPESSAGLLHLATFAIGSGAFNTAIAHLERYASGATDARLGFDLIRLCQRAQEHGAESQWQAFVECFVEAGLNDNLQLLPLDQLERQRLARERLQRALPEAIYTRDGEGRWRLEVDRIPPRELIADLPLGGLFITDGSTLGDLDRLRGMTLHYLRIQDAVALHDLSALAEVSQLTRLVLINATLLSDLSPLQGLHVQQLSLRRCPRVTDLSPLRSLSLTELSLVDMPQITSLASCAGLPLRRLELDYCLQISDLWPIAQGQLESLSLLGCTGIADLGPLRDTRLSELVLDPILLDRGLEALRDLPTLEHIGFRPDQRMTSAYFWLQYDHARLPGQD